jgi:glutathione S-transferase
MDAAAGNALTLYLHPFAAFCQKVLIALYENGTPFTPQIVDLADEAARAGLTALWPIGRFPVLRDEGRGRTVAESSIIIEYLEQRHPGPVRLIPAEAELALHTRMQDRFFDLYVAEPMQKIVTDRLRPRGRNDPHGVEQARSLLQTAYGMVEQAMATRTWVAGDDFSLADCAAAPALFYAGWVMPCADRHPNVARYLDRLRQRPSFARVVEEARPYRHLFPR